MATMKAATIAVNKLFNLPLKFYDKEEERKKLLPQVKYCQIPGRDHKVMHEYRITVRNPRKQKKTSTILFLG